MADFGAPPAHTEILLPLGGKHILSPKPPDAPLGNYRISESELSSLAVANFSRWTNQQSLHPVHFERKSF